MTAKLLTTLKQKITSMRLIPSAGGCFEVTANGELIYSKLATHKFPDEDVILAEIRRRLR
ncbi:MAG: Rdx family protein [Gemmataceae bacterium]|nr:Rdx family protein [Gemmataceae bacterium]